MASLKKWKSVYELIFKYKKVVCLNPKIEHNFLKDDKR